MHTIFMYSIFVVGGIREIVTEIENITYSTNSRFLYIPNENASSVHSGHKPHGY